MFLALLMTGSGSYLMAVAFCSLMICDRLRLTDTRLICRCCSMEVRETKNDSTYLTDIERTVF